MTVSKKTTFYTIENKQHGCSSVLGQHQPGSVMEPLRRKSMLCKSQVSITNKMDQKGAKIGWNARSNSQNKLAKYWWPQNQTMVLSARSRVPTYRDKQPFTLTPTSKVYLEYRIQLYPKWISWFVGRTWCT